ncbi:MAG: 30S ribosomal protein S20, partial [Victivallales bacterium]|nr:30S ribosomal protein S20 [Victivallales bacterium]
MPNIKSAKKRMLTSVKERERNKSRKTAAKTAEKSLGAAVARKSDADQLKGMLSKAHQKLDKAVKSGTIHRNKAARKKSQFSKL